MKIKKSTLQTLLLFISILGLSYFILPLIMRITNPGTIIYEQTNITDEFLVSSEDTTSRIFEPIKNKYMKIKIPTEKLESFFTEVSSFNFSNMDTSWIFDTNTSYYTIDAETYVNNYYYVAVQSDSEKTSTYVFSPYDLYVVEHVNRTSTLPNSSQIKLAYNSLQYDSSLSSKKLLAYSKEVETFAGLFFQQNYTYIPNTLYYYMYINKTKNATNFAAYNYTKSYSFLDCMELGEKTIQFDGTLFAVTYFVNEYGMILYYDPITQEYCGYTILVDLL